MKPKTFLKSQLKVRSTDLYCICTVGRLEFAQKKHRNAKNCKINSIRNAKNGVKIVSVVLHQVMTKL